MEGDAVVESGVKYKGARVPVENVIGSDGKGFKYIMRALDVGRIGAAA